MKNVVNWNCDNVKQNRKKHKNFAKVKFSVSSLLWIFISHRFPINRRLLIY